MFFHLSHKISNELNLYLIEYLKKYPEIAEAADSYLRKKIHLNGLQFYAGFNAGDRSSSEYIKFANIAIAIELVMLWAYKTNRIIDKKQDIWGDEEKIKNTVLEHDLISSLIFKLLDDSKEILKDKYDLILRLVLKMMTDMIDGFWWEQKELCVKNKVLKEILDNWSKKYLKRNIYFDMVYDYAPLIGYYIASGDNNIFFEFENGIPQDKRLSHVGQIVNDLSDWCEVKDLNVKSYQDSFADIRNGYITYPVYCLIESSMIIDALKNPKLTFNNDWKKKALKLLKDKKIVEQVMNLGQECYNFHIIFWKKLLNKEDLLIEDTYGVVRDNKYFVNFDMLFNELS